ncbi:hypothetical protein QE364_003909 [Nocardioides zeae]|uniref:Uncharacterized protein n=1 Tax=Nocardioides zeae TaxID=1457234 RepID=A0ACC6INF1_9ACTN|nr:hypothetical protein [Nocardioides zeae]MDR6212178.1 hypothetical protein [Nocardioides zeae]
MRLRGVLVGVLALVALEAAVRTSESAKRVGGLVTKVASLTNSALSPTVALIPDTRTSVGDLIQDGLGKAAG